MRNCILLNKNLLTNINFYIKFKKKYFKKIKILFIKKYELLIIKKYCINFSNKFIKLIQ